MRQHSSVQALGARRPAHLRGRFWFQSCCMQPCTCSCARPSAPSLPRLLWATTRSARCRSCLIRPPAAPLLPDGICKITKYLSCVPWHPVLCQTAHLKAPRLKLQRTRVSQSIHAMLLCALLEPPCCRPSVRTCCRAAASRPAVLPRARPRRVRRPPRLPATPPPLPPRNLQLFSGRRPAARPPHPARARGGHSEREALVFFPHATNDGAIVTWRSHVPSSMTEAQRHRHYATSALLPLRAPLHDLTSTEGMTSCSTAHRRRYTRARPNVTCLRLLFGAGTCMSPAWRSRRTWARKSRPTPGGHSAASRSRFSLSFRSAMPRRSLLADWAALCPVACFDRRLLLGCMPAACRVCCIDPSLSGAAPCVACRRDVGWLMAPASWTSSPVRLLVQSSPWACGTSSPACCWEIIVRNR